MVSRRQVGERGLQGALLSPEGPGPHPGVLVLGGSGGGTREELAGALVEHGLVCLALRYFGAADLPRALVEVPLEYVEEAARWLAAHHLVNGLPVGAVGGSKGAELALLAAATFPGVIGPVVAIAPASAVFFGLDPGRDDGSAWERSSWSHRGHPVPFVPYPEGAQPRWTEAGAAVSPIYEAALADEEAVARAAIPVERARGPLLLVSGEDDAMWPSVAMGERIVARMTEHGRAAEVTHLRYPGAGHRLLGTPTTPVSTGAAFDYGGSEQADAEARGDAWSQAAGFLRQHL